MKQLKLFLFFLLTINISSAQNIDSFFSIPQTLKLTMSTPQPRLNEEFLITIDMNHLKANIFKSLIGKVQHSSGPSDYANKYLIQYFKADKMGKNEIGPIEFVLDKSKYTSNKIMYEVIEALPNSDKGLWFRKVRTSDSTFCIIIEQRIPANSKTTNKGDSSILLTTEPKENQVVKFKLSYSMKGITGFNYHSNSNPGSIIIDGEIKQYIHTYSVCYFNIVDPKASIKISKGDLENIPADYIFEDIIIQ